MRALVAIWTACVIMACASAEAATSAEKDQARARVASGKRHYELGEFEAALKDYREAYGLTDDPLLLFNIGQCQWKLGDAKSALHSYRSYLRNGSKLPNRSQVEARIAELERRINLAEQAALERARTESIAHQAATDRAAAEKAAQQAAAERSVAERIAVANAVAARAAQDKAASEKAAAAAEKAAAAAEKTAVAAEKTADAALLQPRAIPTASSAPVVVVVPESRGDAAGRYLGSVASPPQAAVEARSPVYARWWFWTIMGAVVAGGVAAALLLRSPDSQLPPCPIGTRCT